MRAVFEKKSNETRPPITPSSLYVTHSLHHHHPKKKEDMMEDFLIKQFQLFV
jgi:hypothetical protein